MNASLTCLVACAATVALQAQTSAAYLVHHEFLPPTSGSYANSGSTGAANDGTPFGAVTLAVSPLGVGVTLGGASGDEILCGPSPLLGARMLLQKFLRVACYCLATGQKICVGEAHRLRTPHAACTSHPVVLAVEAAG